MNKVQKETIIARIIDMGILYSVSEGCEKNNLKKVIFELAEGLPEEALKRIQQYIAIDFNSPAKCCGKNCS